MKFIGLIVFLKFKKKAIFCYYFLNINGICASMYFSCQFWSNFRALFCIFFWRSMIFMDNSVPAFRYLSQFAATKLQFACNGCLSLDVFVSSHLTVPVSVFELFYKIFQFNLALLLGNIPFSPVDFFTGSCLKSSHKISRR